MEIDFASDILSGHFYMIFPWLLQTSLMLCNTIEGSLLIIIIIIIIIIIQF